MNRNLTKTAIRLGALIVLVGWASWAPAAPGGPKPVNVAHPCDVTVADRQGDSILSDGGGIYTNGVDGTEAKLADMKNGVADHLYLVVGGVRNLRLKIPGVTDGAPGGVQTCDLAIFQPNVNESDYQFYNLLPVGSSTADVGQNFGGLFQCRFGPGNRDAYSVTYGSPLGMPGPEDECIVITHGQYGNPSSNPLEWTLTADSGCTAAVVKVLNRKVVGQWVDVDVPFQLTATELP